MDATLQTIDVNALLDQDRAAIVQIDEQWLYVVQLIPHTKYYFSVHATNGYTTVVTELQIDHPVKIITENERAAYNLPIE